MISNQQRGGIERYDYAIHGRPFPGAKPVWPTIILNLPQINVGRTDSNNVILQHASISRNHLKIIIAGGQVKIEDLDSRFGTFINGARIKRAP